jgi:hypothetical protein
MSFFEIEAMENTTQKILQINNSPIFIKKVTNNSPHMVRMIKSHFFGYMTEEDKENPLIVLVPGEIKVWQPLLPMPFTSIHFLAQFHAVTMMANGGYEDAPNSHTFNTCLLRYFKPDLVDKKLLKDHSYIIEIILGDRKEDGQVQFDKVDILESRL